VAVDGNCLEKYLELFKEYHGGQEEIGSEGKPA
jgi:hypothetical protein